MLGISRSEGVGRTAWVVMSLDDVVGLVIALGAELLAAARRCAEAIACLRACIALGRSRTVQVVE